MQGSEPAKLLSIVSSVAHPFLDIMLSSGAATAGIAVSVSMIEESFDPSSSFEGASIETGSLNSHLMSRSRISFFGNKTQSQSRIAGYSAP